MFERFTKESRDLVREVVGIAQESHAPEILPAHLLLAATMPGCSAAATLAAHGIDGTTVRARLGAAPGPVLDETDAEALRTIGIDLDDIRRKVEANFGVGALDRGAEDERTTSGWSRLFGGMELPGGGHLRFTPGAKKSLELALRHAIRLTQKEIRPEHIVLGVLSADDSTVIRLLTDLGVKRGALQDDLEERLRRAA